MPKRRVDTPAYHGDGFGGSRFSLLPTWRAAGLSLAVAGSAAFHGIGTLCAVLIAVVVIVALARLHRHAPHAPTTGDLIASTLGARIGRFTNLIQCVAYAVLAAKAASTLGMLALLHSPDFESAITDWWWPALAVAAVVIATAVAAYLPTRTVGAVAAVLAGVGLLVYFYLALAILARVASGTDPVLTGSREYPSPMLVVAAVIPLALGLVGFEAATVTNNRLTSVARPLGVAVGLIAVCATTLLLATRLGATGRAYDAGNFGLIVDQFYGAPGRAWLVVGAATFGTAAVLAVTWAAIRLAGRLFGAGAIVSILTPLVIAVLTVAMCRNWGGSSTVLAIASALLLLVVYLIAGEANSRIEGTPGPGQRAATQVPRAVLAAVLVAAVLIPLRAWEFDPAMFWPIGVTAAVLAVAALLTGVGRRIKEG